MNLSCQAAHEYLTAKGIKHSVEGDDQEVISTGFGGMDNMDSIKILVIYGDDNEDLGIRVFSLLKFPEAKKDRMYEVCSKMNHQFRWARFYVDEDDCKITMAIDAVIDEESSGRITYELIHRTAGIADDAYPEFMKALWG